MPETKDSEKKTTKAATKAKPKAKAAAKPKAKPKAKAAAKPKAKAAAKPKAKAAAKPKAAPKAEEAKAETPKAPEAPKAEETKAPEAPKVEEIKAEATADAPEAPDSEDTVDPLGKGGVLDTLSTGLKVLGGELKWTVKDFVKGYETKQMRRRLDDEYASLGRLVRAAMEAGETALPAKDGEAGVILAQIEFLEKEIGFLDNERATERAMDMQRRKRSLGRDD